MRSYKCRKSLFGLIPLLLVLAGLLTAQEYRSTLAGRVSDPQGGAIPKVKVTATEMSTNSHYSTVTGGEGLYTFPMLPPGNYELAAEAAGFRKYVQRGINVGTATRLTQDIKLDIGQVSDTVTVTADAPQLNTINASSSQVITTHEVENLPINGRAPMDLAMMGFGVINTGNRDQNRAFENGGFSAMAMGGGAGGNNAVSLDGVPNIGTTGFSGQRAAFSPPVDAVSEVQVSAFNVDASEGGGGGGTIQITTKGGTNTLHGSASEFYESSALNARLYSQPKTSKKPSTHQNNWSATLGGPIYIPKVLNGKDKAFFFFSYEGFKDAAFTINKSLVPTLAERQGIFTGTARIYDPATGASANGKITRTEFSNDVIPLARQSQIARNFLRDFIPLPNIVAQGYNYLNVTPMPNQYRSFSNRLDFNLSERNKLTIKFGTSKWAQDNRGPFSDNPADYDPGRTTTINLAQARGARDLWNAAIDDLHAFTPTLVGNFRLGFNRYVQHPITDQYGYDPTTLGLPAYLRENAAKVMLPQFYFGDGLAGSPGNAWSYTPYNIYQLHTGFTWSKGVHSIKFGGEIQLRDASSLNWQSASGSFNFDNGWVRQNPASSSFSGSNGSLASFLLGLPATNATGFRVNGAQKTDSFFRSLYVHDDWRLRSNLTLNIGLRWESSTPSVESQDRQVVGFDPTATNAITAAAKAAYTSPILEVPASAFSPTGDVIMASKDHRNAYKTHNEFAPRVGFSWSPEALKNRTVVRGGFGLFYTVWGIVQGNVYSLVPLVSTKDNGLTPAATLADPFPNGFKPTPLGGSVSFNNPDMKNQYSQRWSLSIQQQLARDLSLEVGYIGNHSVHLTNNYSLTNLPAQYLSRSATRDQANIDFLNKTFSNPMAGLMPWSSLNGATISRATLLRAYPTYTGVTEQNRTTGSSYYESLLARLSKRFSNGWLLSVNYNFSKLLERNSYLNGGDPTLEKRIAGDDRPHSVTVASTYDLPFGKGRKMLKNANRWVDGALGGWAIAGTYNYVSGPPINWGTDMIYTGGDLQWDPHKPYRVFDKAQFVTGSANQHQYHFRSFPSQSSKWRRDSMNNVNFTLSKNFNVTEKAKLQFRAEAFNLFNRPLFAGPNTNPTQAAFGTITSDPSNTPRTLEGGLRLTF